MQYLYHPEASGSQLLLTGDRHRYLFKVRRHKAGERIDLRNLKDDGLYRYLIAYLDKKGARLVLQSQQDLVVAAERTLHIGWCMIDPKRIEKILPTLNEIGVAQITFIQCERSQKQFRPEFERWQKILLNSSQQCGRSTKMQLQQAKSLAAFVQEHPNAWLLHFSDNTLAVENKIGTIVAGCEGGLTEAEVALFDPGKIAGLDTPLILRSESAVVAAAGKLLL